MHERTATCTRQHRAFWRVVQRGCNYSAFNGYSRTESAYSLLRCQACGRRWRTRAAYVATTPDEKS
jgi:hypothetical protein